MSKTHKEMIKDLYLDCCEEDAKLMGMFHTSVKQAMESKELLQEHYKKVDMVEHPPHYNQGGIKTIDYMKAYSTKQEFLGHLRLTAIKYLSRLMEKEKPLQDAKKAKWYIEKLIAELEE